ncbi:ABC transport system periplasmic binding component [Klebsiella oxytoca]|nr:ABC transport system periplasmic binding component [Klebsiella oxytoca]
MNKFSGKASLMATLVAAWVGASSAQAAEIKIGVVLPLSGALSGYGTTFAKRAGYHPEHYADVKKWRHREAYRD